jgi:cephalosporin hydroxylase
MRTVITIIDEEKGQVTVQTGAGEKTHPLESSAAFEAVSRAWLRAGWDVKYVYGFSWFGRPVIQLPEDMFRIQEVLYSLKPDVVVETGVAHGGSLMFYASLFKAMGRGRVIGIDIEIRPHNRKAIEAHEFASLVTLVEGSSTDAATVAKVRKMISPGEKVLVLLDSNHSKAHVLEELEVYSPLVTPGSYIVACDGIMEQVAGGPRTAPDWTTNNPRQAAIEFVAQHHDFVIEEPAWPFNEGLTDKRVTYWPDAFIKRIR